MRPACVAIVDANRARLYTYADRDDDPAHELHEARDLRRMPVDDAHDAEFARDVVGEIDRLVRDAALSHVIVVASPRMLGELRKVDDVLHREGMVVDEISRDLARLTSPQLHDQLAHLKLIPPRSRTATRFAAR